jgi:hypothetical protein
LIRALAGRRARSRRPGLVTLLRSLSPRSSGERATASGAVSAGSNPVGGTGQRHKFEHSDNLQRLPCQRCDLRKRGRVPDLAPYTCPTAKGRTGELPAQQHHTLTVSGPKTGRCSCADTATKRRWPSPQAPAHTRPAWRTGQPVPPAGSWHRRANRSVTECDRTTLAASACNRRSGRVLIVGFSDSWPRVTGGSVWCRPRQSLLLCGRRR